MLVLDGSFGEGGGQILRNAIAYASVLQLNLQIINIRAGRSQPGLKAQHLTSLQLVAKASGATISGDHVGSQEITYTAVKEGPQQHPLRTNVFLGDTKTAGSITLVLQAIIPYALFGSFTSKTVEWNFKGGTNVGMAPQYEYWEQVFLPMLLKVFPSISSNCIRPKLQRRGYFPKGGGHVQLYTQSCTLPLPAFSLVERGEVSHISIRAFFAGNCPKTVATKMAKAAKEELEHVFPIEIVSIEVVHDTPAVGSGSGIIVIATTTSGCRLAGSAIGSPRQSPQLVGRQAAMELLKTLQCGGCVDDYLQDQLILYMALARGTSTLKAGSLTLHTQTAIEVAEKLCGARFKIQPQPTEERDSNGRLSGLYEIQCEGAGVGKTST